MGFMFPQEEPLLSYDTSRNPSMGVDFTKTVTKGIEYAFRWVDDAPSQVLRFV